MKVTLPGMKIISLNTWMGAVFEPLMAFVDAQAATTDVFCFQEMLSALEEGKEVVTRRGKRVNLLQEFEKRLHGFEVFSCVMQDDFRIEPAVHGASWLGVTTFVRSTLPVTRQEAFFVHNARNTFDGADHGTLGCPCLALQLGEGASSVTVCNVHGTSQPGNKLDTSARLAQSQKIVDFLKTVPGEAVVMGDFNLMPDTESIRMFGQAGYRDLIGEFSIPTTRGTLCKELHPEYEGNRQEFADYTFVSPGVKVKSFDVPDEPISDHLPMVLECEVGV